MFDAQRPAGASAGEAAPARWLPGGRLAPAAPAIAAAALVVFPLVSSNAYWIRELSLIVVLALVVSGLNLTFGHAGELQFGQVFAFGLGCYVTMILAIHVWNDVAALLLIGGMVAAAAGALAALAATRIGGWPLAITSLLLIITIPDLASIFPQATGGLNGLIDIPSPHLVGQAVDSTALCEIAVIVAIAWFAIYRNLVTSRYGVVLRTLRQSPVLAASLGFSPMRIRLVAHALGAFPAGVAGCLFGFISLVVTPSAFGLSLAIGVVAASIVGGADSVYGAIAGAAVLQLGPEGSLTLDRYAPIAYGAVLIVAAIAFHGGLSGLGQTAAARLGRRWRGPPRVLLGDAGASVGGAFTEALDGAALSAVSLSKSYGTARALDDVSLSARPGEVTGLIGSNGSGKTTLLNLICGFGRTAGPGAVRLGGTDITRLSAQAIARRGVARTFQTPSIPRGVSALDVVASGRFARDPRGLVSCVLRLPGYRRSRHADRREALALLDLMGLAEVADHEAATLSLGARRLVELARALCAQPRLLLLDEPAAGLSAEQTRRLGEIIRAIAGAGATVVVIDHDFAFVAGVADIAYVLHAGTLIAGGPAAAVAAEPVVIESFLGRPSAPAERSHTTQARPHRTDAIELSRVVSGYGNRAVLRQVSLRPRRGEIELVLGPSGAGKTTLLATIAGLVPLRAGTIALDGRDVGRLPAHRRAAAGIAYVPEGKRIFRERTIVENVVLGTFPLSLSRRERAALCDEVLSGFPVLQARSAQPAGVLSGGQQQMLAIAQALAARPQILLLDEPSSGLAPSVASEVFQNIRRLSDGGMTVLIVDRLAREALAIADHVTVLDAGGVVAACAPEAYGDPEALLTARLGEG
ncbi:MAG: putative branched-chain amino acid transporter permease/ATP-binding protein [Conexibacter sp.]|nr:putative branched-chain amino acid transporter permease/ATP-binding protein [Conexibacter sp.]